MSVLHHSKRDHSLWNWSESILTACLRDWEEQGRAKGKDEKKREHANVYCFLIMRGFRPRPAEQHWHNACHQTRLLGKVGRPVERPLHDYVLPSQNSGSTNPAISSSRNIYFHFPSSIKNDLCSWPLCFSLNYLFSFSYFIMFSLTFSIIPSLSPLLFSTEYSHSVIE